MKIIIYIVLIITFCNFVLSTNTLLPPSPGPIDVNQMISEPQYGYFSNGNLNGYFPYTEQMRQHTQTFTENYNPIIVLNNSSYLAYTLYSTTLDIVIINSSGVYSIEIQPQLQQLAKSGSIKSKISYDDKTNSFYFLNNYNQIVQYNITSDKWLAYGAQSSIYYDSNTYLDLQTSTFYAVFESFGSYGSVLVLDPNGSKLYSLVSYNLPIEIKNIQVAGYNGNIVLFGYNKQYNYSVVYALDSDSKTILYTDKLLYDTYMVTCTNPEYLIFYYPKTSDMLKLRLSIFSNTYIYLSSSLFQLETLFITSIELPSIFTKY